MNILLNDDFKGFIHEILEKSMFDIMNSIVNEDFLITLQPPTVSDENNS